MKLLLQIASFALRFEYPGYISDETFECVLAVGATCDVWEGHKTPGWWDPSAREDGKSVGACAGPGGGPAQAGGLRRARGGTGPVQA